MIAPGPNIRRKQSLQLRFSRILKKGGNKVACSFGILLASLTSSPAAQMDAALVEPTPDIVPRTPAQTPANVTPPSLTGASSGIVNPVLPTTSSQGTGGSVVGTPSNLLRWGPVQVRPHVDYRLYYATQVYVQPGERQDTVRHSFSPGVLLETDHLSLDYTPTLNYYSKGRFDDNVDHAVSLNANAGVGDWRFGFTHNYSSSSQVLIETARQTDTENHTTALKATYLFSERTGFDFNLNQAIIEASNFNSSRQWSTMNWINHAVSETTTLGAGVGGGFADVESGSDMTYEMIQGRVGWKPGTKLSVNLNGGIEIRQFLDGNSDRINPIMGASISYQVFDQTTVSLEADRSVNTSLLQDQITENTRVSASINQRLLGRVNASITATYRMTDYESSSSRTPIADRSDDTTNLGLSLGSAFIQRGFISVAYRYLRNESNLEGFGFTSNQYTFQIGYRF